MEGKMCVNGELYQWLSGHRSFRLLELLPGQDGDEIEGKLHEHELDHAPPFETISYVWGDQSITRTINCNGFILEITQNLHDALSQFRSASESRLLWTDAIYINQTDLDERASQVMIMHDIYRSSERCLVWLGRADEHSVVAFQIIRDIAAIICREKGILVEDLDRELDENGRDLLLTQKVKFDGLPPPSSRSWISMFRFFGRSWFTRIWVVQELYFAPNSLFYCGNDQVTFAPLYHATHWMLANSSQIDVSIILSISDVFTNWSSNLLSMRGDKLTGQKDQSVDQLLYNGKKFKATDPRDKIYAMINFPAFGNERMDITPDYSRRIEDIYTEVTLAVVRETKTLRIFTCVENIPEKTADYEKFPSWVPLWHSESRKSNVACIWYDHYSASGPTSTPSTTILSDKVISLPGFEFDVIKDVAEISCLGATPVAITRLTPWEPYICLDAAPYPTKQDIITAYAMTFTGGFSEYQEVFGIPVTPEMVINHCAKFIAWIERLRKLDAEENAKNDVFETTTRSYPPGLYSEKLPFLPETEGNVKGEFFAKFQAMVNLYTSGPRRLFRTEKGYLGQGFRTPQVGDKVCVLQGGKVPFVTRERDEGSGYTLVGDAYVHGIMNGEVLAMADKGEIQEQKFELH